MRISRAGLLSICASFLLGGCIINGVDGPPGARGTVHFPLSLGMTAPQYFQTVMVIAPESGARCRARSAQSIEVDSDPVANGRREAFLNVDLDEDMITIVCRKDGETWRREMPSRWVRVSGLRAVVESFYGASLRPYSECVRTFPPLFHVPGADAEASARWDQWHRQHCTAPDDDLLVALCGPQLEAVRGMDLGSGG